MPFILLRLFICSCCLGRRKKKHLYFTTFMRICLCVQGFSFSHIWTEFKRECECVSFIYLILKFVVHMPTHSLGSSIHFPCLLLYCQPMFFSFSTFFFVTYDSFFALCFSTYFVVCIVFLVCASWPQPAIEVTSVISFIIWYVTFVVIREAFWKKSNLLFIYM